MIRPYRVPIFFLAAISLMLNVTFTLPALTEQTVFSPQDIERMSIEQAERRYCRTSLQGVNCVCYGRVTNVVLKHDAPKMRGFVHADRQQLARGQASNSC